MMNEAEIRRLVAEVVDSRHSTRVLRHDVLDPESREPFLDQLTHFYMDVQRRASEKAWSAEV